MNPYRAIRRAGTGSAIAAPLGIAGALLAAAPAYGASTAGASVPSNTALVAAVKKAMLAAHSVHFVQSSFTSGKHSRIVADSGRVTGKQSIVSGKATAEVLVTSKAAYFDGNASGLSTFFGMPSTDIAKVGSKWVYTKSGTSQYTTFKDGIISSIVTASFVPTSAETKSLKVTTSTVTGARRYLLSWTLTSNGKRILETLSVDAAGSFLPVTATGTSGKDHSLTTFSRWGELIKLTTPKPLIALTSLTG